MRILAHIHTFNDADIIDRTIAAVRAQTRPVDEIVVVDNASSDATLAQPGVAGASVLRLPENSGTSGAVYSGLGYAIEHRYDWIWVFDADSIPEPDALEKLLALYDNFPPEQQQKTAFLACLHSNVADGEPRYGDNFIRHGLAPIREAPAGSWYPLNVNIWSGCLYNVAIVREVGLPNQDYVLDWGETEFHYRIMKAGYQGFVNQAARLHHNIRGGHRKITDFPPIRCYYTCRNILYFTLYDFKEDRLKFLRRSAWRVFMFEWHYLREPRRHMRHILAGLRGVWHGITGNIAARYRA